MYIDDLAEHILNLLPIAAVIILLIQKSTRKIMIKILIGFVLIISAAAAIGYIEFYFLKDDTDMFMVVYTLTVIGIISLLMLIMALRDLAETIYLSRHGCRTVGKVIDIGGKNCKIQYHVDGQEYICIGNRLTKKEKCGDDAAVRYLKDNPQKSCMEKEDLASSILITVFALLITAGTIIVGYALM